MAENLGIRQAVEHDAEAILGLIEEAASWLAVKGSDQWQRAWPSPNDRFRRIKRGIWAGQTWLVESRGLPVATISYHRNPDPDRPMWTAAELTDPAVYLSRLVVRRSYAGREIGRDLIDWASLRAISDWRAKWIRVDVWTTNTALHKYYQQAGFEFRRIGRSHFWRLRRDPSAALFQKAANQVSAEAAARFREAGA